MKVTIFCGGLLGGLILGIFVGILLFPILQRQFVFGSFHIQGVVEYSPEPDLTVSATPPEGCYIETKTRFYLNHVDPQLRNKSVFVFGKSLSIKCGNDGGDCYPELQVEDIHEIKNK